MVLQIGAGYSKLRVDGADVDGRDKADSLARFATVSAIDEHPFVAAT